MSAPHKYLLNIEIKTTLMEALDPDALDDIAEEIGADDKHRLRAHALRALAKKQREAIALAEGL